MPHVPDSHAEHEPLVLAALAAGDLSGAELARAERLVAECSTCAELVADLRSIASSTRALPPARRRRDYRLSEADAARLRRRAGWRELVGLLAAPRFGFTRPLAVGLSTLGLAGLLLSAVPAPFLGGSTSGDAAMSTGAGQDRSLGGESALQAAPSDAPLAATQAPAAVLSEPSPSGEPQLEMATGEENAVEDSNARQTYSLPTDEEGTPPLVILSVILLVAGLGLLGLQLAAVRLARGPSRAGRG